MEKLDWLIEGIEAKRVMSGKGKIENRRQSAVFKRWAAVKEIGSNLNCFQNYLPDCLPNYLLVAVFVFCVAAFSVYSDLPQAEA